jgi:hypothetical protein
VNTLGTAGSSYGIEAVLAAVDERQLARELRMTFNTALLTLADTRWEGKSANCAGHICRGCGHNSG